MQRWIWGKCPSVDVAVTSFWGCCITSLVVLKLGDRDGGKFLNGQHGEKRGKRGNTSTASPSPARWRSRLPGGSEVDCVPSGKIMPLTAGDPETPSQSAGMRGVVLDQLWVFIGVHNGDGVCGGDFSQPRISSGQRRAGSCRFWPSWPVSVRRRVNGSINV